MQGIDVKDLENVLFKEVHPISGDFLNAFKNFKNSPTEKTFGRLTLYICHFKF